MNPRASGAALALAAFLCGTAMLAMLFLQRQNQDDRWRRLAATGRNHAFVGRDQDALRAFDEALRLLDEANPAPGPNTAFVLNEKAPVLLRNGRIAEAREASARAVALLEENADLPERTPLALALRHHGEALAAQGDTLAAIERLRESARLWERHEGQASMNLVETRSSLGYALLANGDSNAAEDEFRRAMTGWERATAGRVPPHPPSLLGQALCLLERGDADRASAILDRAMELIDRQAGRDNIHWARGLAGRAQRHRLRGEAEAARRTLVEAAELVERHLGADSAEALRLRARLEVLDAPQP